MTTRAAIYLRLSKDSEASSSIDRQRLACEALCRARGWEVVFVEEDVDVSASKRRLDRPGLDRIRAAYADLDAVVYWKTDRLARSLLDYASLVDEAEAAGVAFVSATEPLDLSSPMGRAMAQVVAIFAELEARTIGLRMESTIAHLREVGRATGGRLPWGYRRVPNPDGPGYVVDLDPDLRPLLREVVDRVLDGDALLAIARDFTARGVPTVSGSEQWNPATFRTLLRNPILLGRTVHRGTVLRGEDGLPLAHVPALLDLAEWRALQAALKARRRPADRRRNGASLLLGIAHCGRCGGRLYTTPKRDKRSGKDRHYYVCGASGRGRACSGVSISRPRLESYVEREFLATLGRLPVLRPSEQGPAASPAELDDVRQALDDLEADRYERGLFPGPSGAARFADLHARLTARLHALETEARPAAPAFVTTGETFAQAWASADTAHRRDLLAAAIETVDVLPTGRRSGGTFAEERLRLVWKPDAEEE